MSDVVLWTSPAKLTGAKLITQLRRALKGRVDEAYLIGSHARSCATSESDIDLILVCETKISWPDRGQLFSDLWIQFGAADLLIYTPNEWRVMKANPTGFIEEALKTAQTLFANQTSV